MLALSQIVLGMGGWTTDPDLEYWQKMDGAFELSHYSSHQVHEAETKYCTHRKESSVH